MFHMLADCLHGLEALGPGGLPALIGALFLAGLAGGMTHCASMCAPFVLAQSAAVADEAARGGTLRRLAGAALLPYQAGRMIGYAMLGAAAGGAAGLVAFSSGLRWLLAALLLLAAAIMLAQASSRLTALLPRLPGLRPRLPAVVERRIGRLLAAPTGWRGLLLGLLLSGLPCGLLYGALAAKPNSTTPFKAKIAAPADLASGPRRRPNSRPSMATPVNGGAVPRTKEAMPSAPASALPDAAAAARAP